MREKVIITGVTGLVGSAVALLFASKGWEILGLDNNQRAKMFGTEYQPTPNDVDIRDEKTINQIFETFKPDAIVHAAGLPSHDWATDHVLEDFDVNTRGTLILLEATRKYCPDAVFVHVSTDKVYGENMNCELEETATRYVPAIEKYRGSGRTFVPQTGFTEDLGLDFAGDRSFFGCSKAAADMYVQQYAARGLTTGIFRPGCITGRNHAGSSWHGFLAYLAMCVKEGKPYKIHGSGKQVRDNIHANDIASAFHAFIENPSKGAVFNIGGGPERAISVLEALKIFEDATGKKAQIEYGEERKGDRRFDVHDVSKFRKDYPEWDYKYSLGDIIKDLCD